VDVEVEVVIVAGVRLNGLCGDFAPGVDFDFDELSELAGEIFDVDAGAAVNIGWVLAGHQAYTH